jgi:hypothetical protein
MGVMQLQGRALLMHGVLTASSARLVAASLLLHAVGLGAVAVAPSILKETNMTDAIHTPTPDLSSGAVSTRRKDAEPTCCGGPAPSGTDACCARDAEVRSTGGAGCGCQSTPDAPAAKKTACCG